ncbi:50S ribosomal protein L9 [Lysinibacter sp. HNR]|uniref:50S ribosomal protein L9 n=1 Tax=Lysinibacter sp. HNR TaxID=3031408 RepID=UPI002435A329|nr:50S ribosomal protein L9 [Lysinibacter sp. HNR]WGD37327.1 50S ribosomal protein L9 [Lysinibacter sp. HNR]
MSKIILTHEVTGLGEPGDVLEVKNGYARNYLFPQGFAVAWTRGGEKQVEQIRAARAARELATIEEAQDIKAKLEAAKVRLAVKTGTGGRLFGSVKTVHIADAVKEAGVAELDKRKIEIPTAIKTTGEYTATVRLRDDINATITLQVISDKKK